MKKEEFMNGLSEEVRQKLTGCKTAEEAREILSKAGVEPMDDELLDEVAGGVSGGRQTPLPAPKYRGVIV